MRSVIHNLDRVARRCRPAYCGPQPWLSPRSRSVTSSSACFDKSNHAQHSDFRDYIEDLLDAPLHSVHNATKSVPALPISDELPKTEEEDRVTKARIVFGSKLAGPAERRIEIAQASQMIAGVMVPPRPEEPDNCCMSGCVNCVWDRYRDELEEWAAKSTEARQKSREQVEGRAVSGSPAQGGRAPTRAGPSMDEDGGGSETNWSAPPASGDEPFTDLFADIPVGIREFMKTEKKLKARHTRSAG